MNPLHLLYHRVNCLTPDPWTLCVSPAHFSEHLEVIARLSPRPVITFDDGYADNLHQALPLLEKYDVEARFFIVSGALGKTTEMWWDALERLYLPQDDTAYFAAFASIRLLPYELQEKELDRLFESKQVSRTTRPDRRMLTKAELCTLAASPLAEIGAHTVTHPVLSNLDAVAQQMETTSSKQSLEELINKRVEGFSYPNGMAEDYDQTTLAAVRRAGFSYAYSAYEHRNPDTFQLPRVMVRDWDGDEFTQVLYKAAARAGTHLAALA